MDRKKLIEGLTLEASKTIQSILVFDEIDSTNAELSRQAKELRMAPCLVAADFQSAGRGRHGKEWLSPNKGGLYMSLGLPCDGATKDLQALSLVSAVAVVEAVTSQYPLELQLKWPNDLLCRGKKIAGILLERLPMESHSYIIFGIGININISEKIKNAIDRPLTDLQSEVNEAVSSELLAAAIGSKLVAGVNLFTQSGFEPFRDKWNRLDRHLNTDVVIQSGEKRMIGKSLGVDNSGCLQLQTIEGIKPISTGEVFPSLREVKDGES